MKAIYFLVIVFFVVVSSETPLEQRFSAWAVAHNKVYKSESERVRRMLVFARNEKLIEKMNSDGSTATFALNKFSDMTEDEFKAAVSFFLIIINIFVVVVVCV